MIYKCVIYVCLMHFSLFAGNFFTQDCEKKIDCTGFKKNVFMHARNERVTSSTGVEYAKRSICAIQAFFHWGSLFFWIVSSTIS